MKAYEVSFTPRAVADFDETLDWYRTQSSGAANKWIAAVETMLDTLEQAPGQFPKAREDGATVGVSLREYSFGAGRRRTHRAVFAIRPNTVVVYAIHHLSRRDINVEDLFD